MLHSPATVVLKVSLPDTWSRRSWRCGHRASVKFNPPLGVTRRHDNTPALLLFSLRGESKSGGDLLGGSWSLCASVFCIRTNLVKGAAKKSDPFQMWDSLFPQTFSMGFFLRMWNKSCTLLNHSTFCARLPPHGLWFHLSYKRRKWKGGKASVFFFYCSWTHFLCETNVKQPPKEPRYFLVSGQVFVFLRGKTRVSFRCSKGCLHRNCFTTFHANLVKLFSPPLLSLRVRMCATIGNQGNRMGRAVTAMLLLLTFISPLSGSGGDVCPIVPPLLSS